MRRAGLAGLSALAILLLGTDCGSDPPPPCEDKCCVTGGVSTLRCGSCNTGEIAVPLDRCNPRDATVSSCGDGRFDAAREQCDPSASAGCAANETCTECMCVANVEVCGDGQITGGESCERNADCTASPDLVCRRCQCALKGARVTFNDTVGDTPATPQGYLLESLSLEIDGGADDVVLLGFVEIGAVQPDKLSEACFVVVLGAGREQRLCVQKAPGMPREATFTGEDGQKRVLSAAEGTPVLVDGVGYLVRYSTALGLRTEMGLSFYAETRYDGMRTDILPDTGTLSFKEIFGE